MSRDPLDELGHRLFAAARNETASRELHARLHEQLRAPPLAAERAPRALPARRARWRWLLAASVLGVGVVLALRVWSPRHAAVAISREVLVREPAQVSASSPAAASPDPVAAPPGGSAAPQLLVPSSAPERARVAAAPDASAARRRVPSQAPALKSPMPSVEPSTAASAGASGAAATLGEELGLLMKAQNALRAGDAQGALSLLDGYTRELGGSALSAEATLLRMEALAALGRSEQARALAERFVRENPNSPLVDRAQSFLQ